MSGWVEAFIVIAAIAIVMQMAIMLGMLLQMKKSLEHFTRLSTDLQGRIDPILTRVNRILEDSEGRISSVMGDTAEITRIARGQAQKIDRVFTDTIERLQIQVIRADQILTGAMEVVDEAGTKFRNTLWGPIRQASAVMKGIKVGLDMLRRQQGGVVESDVASQDEELFI
jgi:5-hydroxyisourate hydrolase-like protein (transthyretin family)